TSPQLGLAASAGPAHQGCSILSLDPGDPMKHWMVVLALLLTFQSAAAQWRPDSSTGGLSGPKRYLTVASREGNARLLVWCSEPVTFQLDMDRRLGIFDFYGTDYVFLKARFLPDTMIYPT